MHSHAVRAAAAQTMITETGNNSGGLCIEHSIPLDYHAHNFCATGEN